jgi:hypothetical protein
MSGDVTDVIMINFIVASCLTFFTLELKYYPLLRNVVFYIHRYLFDLCNVITLPYYLPFADDKHFSGFEASL